MKRVQEIANEIDKILSKVGDDIKENNPAAALMIMINFTLGAMWADKTMIDKACEWIKQDMIDNHAFQGRIHQIEIIEGIVERFKKAME